MSVRSKKALKALDPVDVRGNGQPQELRDMIERLLVMVGEDPKRNGLLKTPERVTKALQFMTAGYTADVDRLLNNALFPIDYDEIIATTEADVRAGRFTHYKSFEDFEAEFIRRTDEIIRRARAERTS